MYRFRLASLNVVVLVAAIILIARLFSLQIIHHENFSVLAAKQHDLYETLVPARGQIFARENRNGEMVPIVTNIERSLVFAEPPRVMDKSGTAAVLSKILGLTKAEILGRISDDSRKWVVLKKELPESEAVAVSKLGLSGIGLEPERFRFYPERVFASQVLGFYGFHDESRVGQYGLEEYFEDELTGRAGSVSLVKDIGGAWITGGERDILAAQDGADLTLTLDRTVQYQAESILKDAVEKYEGEDGSLVVLDPKTGAVVALANFPSYDPNEFNKAPDAGVYRNRAITDAYEPGSVFKAFTMGAALDSEAVTPDMTYEDTGSVKLDDFTIRNALDKVFGTRTMTQVLEESINTGAIFAQQKTGPEKFYEAVKRFGFGKKSGVTLPGEAAGDLRNLDKGGKVHFATASFGQGITVNLLQLAQGYGAIANGGKLMKSRIVEKIDHKNGQIETFAPEEAVQVISPKAAYTLGAMLVSVVENGHGKRAGVPGYFIAGKTGTAQIARTDGRGYDPDRTIGSFVGFGPVEDPRFVIAVKITNPGAARFAESSAAPTFGEMAKFLLNYYQISPTR